jgi:uncharacterized protein (TIGR02099 family)
VHGPAEKAAEVIETAEELVERAVFAAERSLVQRVGLRGLRIVLVTLRAAWLLIVVAYFAFAVAVLVTRYYLLPHIDDWRPRIESTAAAALHAPVTIAAIEADWQGLYPRLLLRDVAILGTDGSTTLALGRVDAVLSWTSLLALQPRMHSLSITSPQFQIRRLRDHRFNVAGFLIDPQSARTDTTVLDWVLAQGRISVLNARVHFVDELAETGERAAVPSDHQAPQPPQTTPIQPTVRRDMHTVLTAFSSMPDVAPAPADPEVAYDFTDVNFHMTRGLTGHRFSLRMHPPAELAGPLDLRGQFSHAFGEPTSRMASWSGKLFLQFDYADLSRLQSLVHLIPAPARLDRGQGAMRAWMDFTALQITRLRADVALTDVDARLRPDLEPLRLDRVQGRITQTLTSNREGDTQELALIGLSMDGPDQLHLPPTDLLFRTTRTHDSGKAPPVEQSRFEANHIVLSDWSRLARQFPLPPSWLGLIERTAAQGTLEDLHASWDGPQTPSNYALRARFSGLGFKLGVPTQAELAENPPLAETEPGRGAESPVPPAGETGSAPAPYAFENLVGSIDLTQDAGSLRLDGNGTRLQLPALLGERVVKLDSLSAQLRWMRDSQSRLNLNVDSLAAANEDIELRGSGSYRSGGNGGSAGTDPAHLDVSGRITRAKVSAVPRYLPTFLPGPTRAWLLGALLDGSVSEGSFFVRGDPKHFPFVDPHSGDFHVGLQVQAGRIDFAPAEASAAGAAPSSGTVATETARVQAWPELSGIDAQISFDRDRMAILASHARAYGYELVNISAQIPHLGTPNQHLSVDGQGSGSVTEMLRYVSASPVNRWTGSWLSAAKGSGPTRLALKLDIPLARASDTTVAGSVYFQGANLVLRPDVPAFSNVNGELDFTQRGIRLVGVSAGFLGGEVRLGGESKADGAVAIQGSGTATPQDTRSVVTPVALQRLLDYTRGQFHYNATLTLQKDAFGLQVDTDLQGLATNLPPPFRKTAAEARQLHFEITPVAGTKPARDTVRASLAGGLDLELQRLAGADGGMQLERGVIGVGVHANVPDNGVLLFIDQPSLDVDRWQALLNTPAPAGANTESPSSSATPAKAADTAPDTSTLAAVPFDQVVLRANTLTLAAKTISNVSLSARRDSSQTWLADIDSDQASGSVRWIDAAQAGHGHLTARLTKLTIPERDQKQVSDLLATPPTEFPELDIVADQFELGKHSLGRLEVDAQSSGERPNRVWNLAKLVISNPDGTVTGSGAWRLEGNGGARRMTLKISMNCSNAGNMLDRFGLSGYIKNGNGKLDGDLSWVGTPFSVDFPSLSGNLHLAAEKGQVLRLDAGAGRLLAVFSFQSFWNIVTGDLREFSAGVAFDSVSANASIAKGMLNTDDFLMKGNSGAGRIKGSLDLLAQTQNLQIVVVPEVSASAATLAYAAFVNPAIGLSTFVGTFLLNKPLSAVFTRVFSVTGPWSNPQIKSIKGETALPAVVPAAPTPPTATTTAPSVPKP